MSSQQTLDAVAAMHRIEVRPRRGEIDPRGAHMLAQARRSLDATRAIRTARVYLIEAPLADHEVQRIADELLADPVNQSARVGAAPTPIGGVIEVHYQPGVMDPVAQSTRDAMIEMLPHLSPGEVEVRTGCRYDLEGEPVDVDVQRGFAERFLANTVIQDIHLSPYHPESFEHGHVYELCITEVPLRDLDEQALLKLSRESHLFLSGEEMRAIQDYYRDAGREPTDIELETLAQTWSEHCVHKTLKSTIHYKSEIRNQKPKVRGAKSEIDFTNRPGHTVHDDGSVTIENLLKSTIAAATFKLRETAPHGDWLVSVFDDNAGIVKFDDEDAVCIKVETHNHPTAIEPYGGAATGIGGCIRDVMGTGLSARPIANTDIFAVAPPAAYDATDLPKGVLHPKRILRQVVAGVRDYGNRMGIPTVNGAVCFHDNFLGNPLVFAGCVGLLPLDKCFGEAQPGDRIIVLGGATGRDGIHGATFSSAELTDSHADEFSHAVQIGNPITEKKMLDVILRARGEKGEASLFHAITDCGAGGFSSAVGEMGEKVGAIVHLERAPLKYPGLSYTEIWISEAQERMVLAVPSGNVERLRRLCDAEDVAFCDLGTFGLTEGDTAMLSLNYHGTEVGRLCMKLLHDGIPTPVRKATWGHGPLKRAAPARLASAGRDVRSTLHALLSHPNIASKHWIIRQYDHEVQGGSVVKPLIGPEQDGPSDAAVIRPKLDSRRGIALSCGLAPNLSEAACGFAGDSYHATLAAIDEAVRNAVCVGANPTRIAILDNFCWPSCDDPAQLGALVRAAEACYDGALAYDTPFVSGKDSLNNQFTTEDGRVITIPQTLLITALGMVEDTRRCVTMDAKSPGNALLIVGKTNAELGGSHLAACGLAPDTSAIPRVNLRRGPAAARAVASLIRDGLIASAHDCSDGGLLVAAAEMAFAGRVGLDLDLKELPCDIELDPITACFAESPSRYLIEVAPDQFGAVIASLRQASIPCGRIGAFADHDRLKLGTTRDGQLFSESLDALRHAWLKPLDW